MLMVWSDLIRSAVYEVRSPGLKVKTRETSYNTRMGQPSKRDGAFPYMTIRPTLNLVVALLREVLSVAA